MMIDASAFSIKWKVFRAMGLGVYMPMGRNYKTQLKHFREII